jgi:hypothetical protein
VGEGSRKWVMETAVGQHSASGRLPVAAWRSGRSAGITVRVQAHGRHRPRDGRKRPGGLSCWSGPRPFTDLKTCPINPRFFQIFE